MGTRTGGEYINFPFRNWLRFGAHKVPKRGHFSHFWGPKLSRFLTRFLTPSGIPGKGGPEAVDWRVWSLQMQYSMVCWCWLHTICFLCVTLSYTPVYPSSSSYIVYYLVHLIFIYIIYISHIMFPVIFLDLYMLYHCTEWNIHPAVLVLSTPAHCPPRPRRLPRRAAASSGPRT